MNEGKMTLRYIPLARAPYRYRLQWKSTIGMGSTAHAALRDWVKQIRKKAEERFMNVDIEVVE